MGLWSSPVQLVKLHLVLPSRAGKSCDCFSQRQFCIIINSHPLWSFLEDVEGNLRSNTGGEGSCVTAKPQLAPAALFEQHKTFFFFRVQCAPSQRFVAKVPRSRVMNRSLRLVQAYVHRQIKEPSYIS